MSVLPSEMSDDEIEELGKVTLHGPLPEKTVRRLWMGALRLIQTIKDKDARIEKLRKALVDVINLGTDGSVSNDASDEVLCEAPTACAEVKKKLDIRKHCRA